MDGKTSGNLAGRKRRAQFLSAARDLMVTGGVEALTLRGLARACNVPMGLVTYHFRSKQDLLRASFSAAVSSSDTKARHVVDNPKASPEARLRHVLKLLLKQTGERVTNNLMMEVWSVSNRDPFVRQVEASVYEPGFTMLAEIIGQVRPDLKKAPRRLLAIHITTVIVGQMVFAGANRQWQKYAKPLHLLAVDSLVQIVEGYGRPKRRQRTK